MSYTKWWEAHAKKHSVIMEKLKNIDNERVIEYFDFENMLQKEPDFCLLYAEKKKCHEMKSLNCFMCACPYFRFKDDKEDKKSGFKKDGEKIIRSYCSIDAKEGKTFAFENEIHQDCSQCHIPHTKGFIKKHFSRDWKEIMQNTCVK